MARDKKEEGKRKKERDLKGTNPTSVMVGWGRKKVKEERGGKGEGKEEGGEGEYNREEGEKGRGGGRFGRGRGRIRK